MAKVQNLTGFTAVMLVLTFLKITVARQAVPLLPLVLLD